LTTVLIQTKTKSQIIAGKNTCRNIWRLNGRWMHSVSANTKSRDFINAKSRDSANTMSQQYASSHKTIYITHICNDAIYHLVYIDESMCIELACKWQSIIKVFIIPCENIIKVIPRLIVLIGFTWSCSYKILLRINLLMAISSAQ
jgi:hypothetical protein